MAAASTCGPAIADGTTFSVELPPPQARAQGARVAMRVLIVDDEADIRDSLAGVIRGRGLRGHDGGQRRSRRSTRCAASSCRASVILDLVMPVLGGNEVYAEHAADPRLARIPVIVSTSDPSRAPSGVLIMKKPVNLVGCSEPSASTVSRRTSCSRQSAAVSADDMLRRLAVALLHPRLLALGARAAGRGAQRAAGRAAVRAQPGPGHG